MVLHFAQELKELATEDEKHIFAESKASARLGKKIDNMIDGIEERLQKELQDSPGLSVVDADGWAGFTLFAW